MDRMDTKGQMIDQLDLRGVPHSGFDRSNHSYGTGKLGAIIPVRFDEVYPGDRIKGRPEVVANFEPLVAPLMGSMVLKQESFFVPYIDLWRHGWKFFTGKNGFNENMPSISPREIFDVYNEYVHQLVWSTVGGDDLYGFAVIVDTLHDLLISSAGVKYSEIVGAGGLSLEKHWQSIYDSVFNALKGFFEPKKMVDLIVPALDTFKRVGDSTLLHELSDKFEDTTLTVVDRNKLIYELVQPIAGAMHDFYNYFHGPSSLFDYLGWPVPLDDDIVFRGTPIDPRDIEGVTNSFEFAVYMHIFVGVTGDYSLYDVISSTYSEIPLSFMPFKAYYLIWYWNYRDQLLETGILDPQEDEFLGSEITADMIFYCTILRQRCWFKDTFTTALTNTGDGNLLVPTTQETLDYSYYDEDGNLVNTTDKDSAFKAGATIMQIKLGSLTYKVPMNYLQGAYQDGPYDGSSQTSSQFISLDLFDRVKRLRSFVQKRLVLGYEVDDVVYSSFMVRMSQVRQHVPELLGRGRDSVRINTVVNNTSTAEQIAGDRTATAYAHGQQSEMNYFSEDWGLTLSFMTILPIQSYAGSMQRYYLKRDVFDYMWPEFATMGMDAVYNCELSSLGRLTDEQGLMVFGYQGRYYDLKSRQDEEHGRLLTDLNYLTFSREWNKDNPPKLNYMFVHCWPRLDGFVVDSPLTDVFRYDCYNAHAWERRLPVPSEIVG